MKYLLYYILFNIKFVETKVGAKLSDLTTRRVIVLVMSIMFSIPIFTVDTYYDPTVSFDTGLGYVQMYLKLFN